jgi:hypothetical protein
VRTEQPEQQALERLAAYSFLARMLDSCIVERHEGETPADT